jgi:hypothetical protein
MDVSMLAASELTIRTTNWSPYSLPFLKRVNWVDRDRALEFEVRRQEKIEEGKPVLYRWDRNWIVV